jgi:hypothetical protein
MHTHEQGTRTRTRTRTRTKVSVASDLPHRQTHTTRSTSCGPTSCQSAMARLTVQQCVCGHVVPQLHVQSLLVHKVTIPRGRRPTTSIHSIHNRLTITETHIHTHPTYEGPSMDRDRNLKLALFLLIKGCDGTVSLNKRLWGRSPEAPVELECPCPVLCPVPPLALPTQTVVRRCRPDHHLRSRTEHLYTQTQGAHRRGYEAVRSGGTEGKRV